MSTSLKNAVKRKTHKERSQLSSRKKYGLLEKHKDYKLRANDYHRKQDAIRTLKGKAAERNPDEFYFAMQKAKTKDGVHVQESAVANKYSQDELMIMKHQDVGYVQMKAQIEAKKLERLRASHHIHEGETKKNKHIVFVDSKEEAESFDPEEFFDTPKELLGRTFNRPLKSKKRRRAGGGDGEEGSGEAGAGARGEEGGSEGDGEEEGSGEEEEVLPGMDKRVERRVEKLRGKVYRSIEAGEKRLGSLKRVREKMAMDRELMGRGRKTKVVERNEYGQITGHHFKWARERKK